MNVSLAWCHFTLLATDLESFFRGLGSQFSGKRARVGWSDALIILGVIAVVGLAASLLSRYLAKTEHARLNSPRALFRELCRLHGLKFRERQAMRRLARFHRLAHPARLFLEPDRFGAALEHPLLQMHARQLSLIRERLFASTAEGPG